VIPDPQPASPKLWKPCLKKQSKIKRAVDMAQEVEFLPGTHGRTVSISSAAKEEEEEGEWKERKKEG
jgi:hypothetical protein